MGSYGYGQLWIVMAMDSYEQLETAMPGCFYGLYCSFILNIFITCETTLRRIYMGRFKHHMAMQIVIHIVMYCLF